MAKPSTALFGSAELRRDRAPLRVEEATILGELFLTLWEQAERPTTVEVGTNRLALWPLTVERIRPCREEAAARGLGGVGGHCPDGWDGTAARREVEALAQ